MAHPSGQPPRKCFQPLPLTSLIVCFLWLKPFKSHKRAQRESPEVTASLTADIDAAVGATCFLFDAPIYCGCAAQVPIKNATDPLIVTV